jgi:hypothetical protein
VRPDHGLASRLDLGRAGDARQDGQDSNLYDAEIRTDVEWITKKPLKPMRKNLVQYDAIVFCSTTGELPLTDDQKADFLSFVRDEGKGFVGIHAALDTLYQWPEYGEMIGGWFDGHPWNTFDAPVIIEDPAFPAMKHFKGTCAGADGRDVPAQAWSREKVNVLMRLDDSKLDYSKAPKARGRPRLRAAWSKMYGKGPRLLLDARPHPRVVAGPSRSRRCTSKRSAGCSAAAKAAPRRTRSD